MSPRAHASPPPAFGTDNNSDNNQKKTLVMLISIGTVSVMSIVVLVSLLLACSLLTPDPCPRGPPSRGRPWAAAPRGFT